MGDRGKSTKLETKPAKGNMDEKESSPISRSRKRVEGPSQWCELQIRTSQVTYESPHLWLTTWKDCRSHHSRGSLTNEVGPYWAIAMWLRAHLVASLSYSHGPYNHAPSPSRRLSPKPTNELGPHHWVRFWVLMHECVQCAQSNQTQELYPILQNVDKSH